MKPRRHIYTDNEEEGSISCQVPDVWFINLLVNKGDKTSADVGIMNGKI